MARTAINLYSVRELDEPVLDVLDRVGAAGYDGVQFSGGLDALGDATAREVADALDDLGLDPTPPHVGLGELQSDLPDVVAAYGDEVGCDGAVVPYVDGENFASADAADDFAAEMNDLADDLDTRDWGLHYHNHDFEFTPLDGETAFDRFADAVDAYVELDVGWALAGGVDPVEQIHRLDDQLDLVHMKDVDVDGPTPVEIGEGDVDMQACADAAREVGASWLIYEHDHPEDPAASIETGAAFLEDL
jgi:sugar phosphate isomerase/epimerase